MQVDTRSPCYLPGTLKQQCCPLAQLISHLSAAREHHLKGTLSLNGALSGQVDMPYSVPSVMASLLCQPTGHVEVSSLCWNIPQRPSIGIQ